jgi:glycosyltransferase involved in cell wall biosynthesis
MAQVLTAPSCFSLLKREPELKQRVRLMLVGDGSMKSAIENRISEAGIGPLVWMTGSRNDVSELMAALDVFVLPSKAEGISNTILEAMATGLPVIATEVGGNSQLVLDGETGFIIPSEKPSLLAEKLYEYINKPELLESHAKAGRLRAEQQFSLQHMVNQYQTVYDELLVH